MTTLSTDCVIHGDYVTCPADSAITLNEDETTTILANLTCPLDAVTQSNFILASQRGLCECETNLFGPGQSNPSPVNCGCYACPLGSRIGFAFGCDIAVIGPCFNFSCDSQCNGDLGFFDPATYAPTQAPTASPAAFPMFGSSSIGMCVTAFVTLLLFRSIR